MRGLAQYTGRIDYGVRAGDDEVVLFPFDSYAIPFRSGLHCSIWGPNGGDGVRSAQWSRDRLGYLAVAKYVCPAGECKSVGAEGQSPFKGST